MTYPEEPFLLPSCFQETASWIRSLTCKYPEFHVGYQNSSGGLKLRVPAPPDRLILKAFPNRCHEVDRACSESAPCSLRSLGAAQKGVCKHLHPTGSPLEKAKGAALKPYRRFERDNSTAFGEIAKGRDARGVEYIFPGPRMCLP